MSYIYESFIITSTTESHGVDQLAQKLMQLVPNITIEGPFYYQDDAVTNPNSRSYSITHASDDSFQIIISNDSDKLPTATGRPNSKYGTYNEINGYVTTGNQVKVLGYIPTGTMEEDLTLTRSAEVMYLTIVAGEEYLLWNISSSAPPVNIPLYAVYTPLYDIDKSTYALAYPGIRGYFKGNSSIRSVNTFKDTLSTNGKISPTNTTYGLAIGRLNRYAYPSMDIAKPADKSNYKPILTKNIQMYIQTIYGGSSSISGGETNRKVDSALCGRDCALVLANEHTPEYPRYSILVLDGKDYYISNSKSSDAQGGFAVYILFEL